MYIYLLIILIPLSTFAKDIQITGRLQGSLVSSKDYQDFYVRRARVNFKFNLDNDQYIYTDVRSDKVNLDDEGEGGFALGDFFLNKKLNESLTLRLFRSKVDVSYTQTSSSKDLTVLERPKVSDIASNFISQSRRASNIQLLGEYKNLGYQIVIGDGVHSSDLEDLDGTVINSIEKQRLMYGTKLRYYFFDNTDKNIKEVFLDPKKSLSIGLGAFFQDNLEINYANKSKTLNRKLFNFELRYVHEYFHLLLEYFKFQDDLIDLATDTFDDSHGYYLLGEYFFLNSFDYSVYFRVEDHNRNPAKNNFNERSYGLGFNHYLNGQGLRIGVFGQKLEQNNNLSIQDESKFNLYITMSY